MWPFTRKPKLIRITLINDKSGEQLADFVIPPVRVSDNIAEPGALVEFDCGLFEVVSASPATKADGLRTGKVSLRGQFQKILSADSFRYRDATIERTLPDMVKGNPEACFELMEGDWRQMEFISRDQIATVELEFEAIRQAAASGSPGTGYMQTYLRDSIRKPLGMQGVSFEDLRRRYPSSAIRPLWIGGFTNVIKDGFAIEVSVTQWLYGINDRGRVRVLGAFDLQNDLDPAFGSPLGDDFVLVNWPLATVVPPGS